MYLYKNSQTLKMSISSIRTLFITKQVPYPPIGGVALRNWQNMNIMMKFGQVAVFTVSNWSPNKQSLPGVDIWKHCNVEKQRSLQENLERRLWWLFPMRHPDADWAYSKKAAQELELLIQEFKPNLLIFEEVWLYRYLPVAKGYEYKIIFDNHNVETHLFGQRDYSSENLRIKLKTKIQLNHLNLIEEKFIKDSDQVWVCSEEDTKLIQELYGKQTATFSVPNGVNIANYDQVRLGECTIPSGLENKEHNLLFLGQMSYLPNTEATKLLIDQIYPQIKKIYPDSRLLLVGRNPTQKMTEAAKKDAGIIVTGSVVDVLPYLAAASVMVVPLLKGGGTRLKILEAFAAGCPVISTSKGAEGIKAKDGEHLLIRDSIEEIIAGVCQLWSDPSLGNKLAESAYNLVTKEYSWEAVNYRVKQALDEFL